MSEQASREYRGPVRLEVEEGGAVWRAVLATPKANILDAEKVEVLSGIFDRARQEPHLKAIVLCGEGAHFSFGASVQEHLPGRFRALLEGFHGLLRRMLEASIPTLAVVRGQCLGGGLELAAFCNRVIASPDARLGQPEIVLGVFPPVGSVFLAERVGRGRAEDLCLSGRSVTAEEACRMGLVDEVAEDPMDAAKAYIHTYLLPRSAMSLRLAVRALRRGMRERFLHDLEDVEELYCEDLMVTADAQEGLNAFLEKRAPRWEDR